MKSRWQVREVDWPADAAAAVAAFADGWEIAWLDGAADGSWSLIADRPRAVLEQFDGRAATLRIDGVEVDRDANVWDLWRRAVERLPRLPTGPVGLTPGWVGYVGFEASRQLERLPASHVDDLGLPVVRMALFERGVVLDHQRRRAVAIAVDPSPCPFRRGERGPSVVPAEDFEAYCGRWQRAARARVESCTPTGLRLRFEWPREEYEHAVRRALEYIAAGDIYQVNLAQRLWIEGVGDALAAYAALRRANPAPYGAFLRWAGGAIASVSPELFLQVRDGAVLTRPIKGTRPHTGDAAVDERHRRALLESEKEAAELAMIVDLHRNDLGRVCAFGSVRVPQPRRIEAHPTVYHTVADVVGRLAPGRDALDLLRACFPAGSISGVPKIRALEIIDELEPVARGAYTGAIGVLGLDGQMTFNVAIRTLQIRGETATLAVGGGIVADSEPAAEYAETLAKARGILCGLGLVGDECEVAARR